MGFLRSTDTILYIQAFPPLLYLHFCIKNGALTFSPSSHGFNLTIEERRKWQGDLYLTAESGVPSSVSRLWLWLRVAFLTSVALEWPEYVFCCYDLGSLVHLGLCCQAYLLKPGFPPLITLYRDAFWRDGSVDCLTWELYSLFDCGVGKHTRAHSQGPRLSLIQFQNRHKNFKTLSSAHKSKRERSLAISWSYLLLL